MILSLARDVAIVQMMCMPHLSQYSARIFLTTLMVYYTNEELKGGLGR